MVLFCPYLILNNSGFKDIKLREFGLTTNIDSHQDEEDDFIQFKKIRSDNPALLNKKLLTPTRV